MKPKTKERPILFSGEMVRAIIDGRKTQTRRIMKVQPPGEGFQLSRLVESSDRADRKNEGKLHWIKLSENGLRIVDSHNVYFNCPYGKVGDGLWVRETFCKVDDREFGDDIWFDYRATHKYAESHPAGWDNEPRNPWALKWKQSIHMPRSASRILLEITGVRVERLNDISDADAWAEGVDMTEALSMPCADGAAAAYSALWERINGKGSWDLNPWVWAIEFKVLEIKQ